ncbi:hypothetical protein RUND412_002664 [Rhizina undulata]
MFLKTSARPLLRSAFQRRNGITALRAVSTLPNNPYIYILPSPDSPSTHVLSLLPTFPPTPSLSLGTTTTIPPTPQSFEENKSFLPILQSVLRECAYNDPLVKASASTYASPGGATIFSARRHQGTAVGPGGTGAGGANIQGGMGGGGVGGWAHVYDMRNPPWYGRIADPQDIFGSVNVDADGQIQEGEYEECRAYRIVTNEGVLGLSDYLREKVVERLKEEEKKLKV